MKYRSENNNINLLKFLCCFFIVGLHSSPLFANNNLNYFCCQWLFRFCVPFFFITTGYFFLKMDNSKRKEYIKKIIIIYIIAVLIYLPFIVKPPYNIHEILKLIFLGYHHLWYLVSLAYALIILYFIYKNKSFKRSFFLYLIIISLLLLGAFFDEYYKIFNISAFKNLYYFFNTYFFGGRNFLFFAIPMVLIGMVINNLSDKIHSFKMKYALMFVIFSFIASFLEALFLKEKISGIISNDVTLFNYLPAIALVVVALKKDILCTYSTKAIRKIADIIYIIHPFIIYYVTKYSSSIYWKLFIISYIISLTVSSLFYYLYIIIKKLLHLRK